MRGLAELVPLAERALRASAWQDAVPLLREALALDAANPLLHVALGQALQHLGQGDEALACFRRAADIDPQCAEAYAGLAAEHGRAGRVGERDDCLRRWLEIRVARAAPVASPRAKTASVASPRAETAPPATRVPDTTLVCVDCRYYALAADALRRSLARCRFARALLLTDADIRVDGVETVRIAPISSIEAYNGFMMKELDRHIDTGFALVMQYDGYVLSGSRWSPDFQDYDYVGAPWNYADGMDVGNGGFSLRSKRMLRALQDPDIAIENPEDIAICRTYRPLLEQRHGIRFAPAEVAARFSFESLPPPAPTFGFHGVDHLYYLLEMSDAQIAGYRPPR